MQLLCTILSVHLVVLNTTHLYKFAVVSCNKWYTRLACVVEFEKPVVKVVVSIVGSLFFLACNVVFMKYAGNFAKDYFVATR